MLYTIDNGRLKLTVDSMGAQIMNLVWKDGTEYIWQGSPDTWKSRSPVLFPFIGRLTDNTYRYMGKVYPMTIHGFAKLNEFALIEQTDTVLAFELRSTPAIKEQYPFDFVFQVIHTLEADTMTITYRVTNLSGDVMPFAIGGHPGFNVPLDGKGAFTDYYLEFANECSPDTINLTERCLRDCTRSAFPLENGKILRLRHDLFDHDAIFLARADSTVTLKSDKTERSVTLTYPDMPYVGVWHKPKMEAPFVCVEPWCGLPGIDDVMEDMETRSDMYRVQPGSEKQVEFSMIFN